MNTLSFITTTLNPSFAKISRQEVKRLFPDCNHYIIEGVPHQWPMSWFYWLGNLSDIKTTYYCFLDDDAYVYNREEIIKILNMMQTDNIQLYGPADAWNPWRKFNPVACNPFFMIGNTKFTIDSWKNAKYESRFEKKWYDDLMKEYPFAKNGKINIDTDYEPFYCFFWSLKKNGGKFKYFYQEQDPVHKGTNLRISPESPIFCKHLWYSRFWNSNMDVFGVKNIDRYRNFLRDEYRFVI